MCKDVSSLNLKRMSASSTTTLRRPIMSRKSSKVQNSLQKYPVDMNEVRLWSARRARTSLDASARQVSLCPEHYEAGCIEITILLLASDCSTEEQWSCFHTIPSPGLTLETSKYRQHACVFQILKSPRAQIIEFSTASLNRTNIQTSNYASHFVMIICLTYGAASEL